MIRLPVMHTEICRKGTGYLAPWNEYHLCTLTTLRPDGRPHVIPVGVTLDADAGIARITTRKSSRKEGAAEVCTDDTTVDDAVTRYGKRYGRTPDPERAVIEITIDRAKSHFDASKPGDKAASAAA
ncbi:TIGR03618 family F420-dependent PPOX class oxidoreductase [Streptomyces chiangmaiensis]